jgi:glycosyltransferase involved in cell wall biosynthesis
MSPAPPLDVTIVLPVYNGRAHVRDAIDSVLAQTTAGWRLLVIDDDSTDDSAAAVASFCDERIVLRRNAGNLGLYGTLARAVAGIDTEWTVILMQDDRLLAGYLSAMAEAMARHPAADGFWTKEHTIDATGARVATAPERDAVVEWAPGLAPWSAAMTRGCIWTISGSCTRTSALRQPPLGTDLPHCGDFDWFLRASRTRPFVHLARPLIELRRHDGQTSTRHMREGRNLAETAEVLERQLRAFPADLPWRRVWSIAIYRAGQCARSLAGNVVRGHLSGVRTLIATAARLLALPVRTAAWRWARGGAVAAPAREGARDAGRR